MFQIIWSFPVGCITMYQSVKLSKEGNLDNFFLPNTVLFPEFLLLYICVLWHVLSCILVISAYIIVYAYVNNIQYFSFTVLYRQFFLIFTDFLNQKQGKATNYIWDGRKWAVELFLIMCIFLAYLESFWVFYSYFLSNYSLHTLICWFSSWFLVENAHLFQKLWSFLSRDL